MTTKSVQELRALGAADGLGALQQELLVLRRHMFELRLSAVRSHVRDYPSRNRDLRKGIARLLTILDEMQRG